MIALLPVAAVGNAEWWEAARARLSESTAITDHEPLSALLDVIDEGRAPLRALGEAAADAGASAEQGSALAALVDFIQTDVLDAFRSLAEDSTEFVSAAYGTGEAPQIDDVQGDAEDFVGWVAVLGLAASSPVVPDRLASAMRAAADALQGWDKRLAAELERAGA